MVGFFERRCKQMQTDVPTSVYICLHLLGQMYTDVNRCKKMQKDVSRGKQDVNRQKNSSSRRCDFLESFFSCDDFVFCSIPKHFRHGAKRFARASAWYSTRKEILNIGEHTSTLLGWCCQFDMPNLVDHRRWQCDMSLVTNALWSQEKEILLFGGGPRNFQVLFGGGPHIFLVKLLFC